MCQIVLTSKNLFLQFYCHLLHTAHPTSFEIGKRMSRLIPHSVEEVCEAFRKASIQEVEHMAELGGSTFCRDPLCPDTLVFSQQHYALVQFSNLTDSHVLHTQVM